MLYWLCKIFKSKRKECSILAQVYSEINLLIKVTFGVTVAELEGLPRGFAVRR